MSEIKLKINVLQVTLSLVLLSWYGVGCSDVVFHLFTADHSKLGYSPTVFTPATTPDDYPEEVYGSKEYFFLVHGWISSPKDREFVEMKTGILQSDVKEKVGYVIMVDWSDLASDLWYFKVKTYIPLVGHYLSHLIISIRRRQPNAICWCVGHSLGAHICGNAGHTHKINRIVGIDPAGNGFDLSNGLNPEAADFVHVIHTTATVGTWGTRGHADYYANGGHIQPSCALNPDCHHRAGLDYFTRTTKTNTCYASSKCDLSYFWLKNCVSCTNCKMAFRTDPKRRGVFYISPYISRCNG